MYCGIGSDESYLRTQYTDQNGKHSVSPIASVVECCEDVLSRGYWTKYPKRHENANKADEVEQQDETLNDGKVLGEYSIDEEGKEH